MASRESYDETNGGPGNAIDTSTCDVESDGSSTKKRKLLHAPFRQRKRATTACQFCRLRKTKCDNVRPVCGFCRYHRAKCVYSDTVTMPEEEGAAVLSERSDTQHNQLLSRLDRIEELLRLPQENNSFGDKRGEPRQLTEASAAPSLPINKTKIFFFPSTRSEAPLKWPIFNGFLDERYTRVNSFILDPPLPETCDTPRSVFTSSSVSSLSVRRHDRVRDGTIGIRDEALVPLCRKFLTDVHVKNPILEGSQLIAYAIDCVEHGLKWDAPSCLVLLACALACYTDPWTPPGSVDLPTPDSEIPKGADAAAVYWLAAKKRIGLLESSLVDIQCLFFASVYERSAFRSLNSWLYLQQAATRLHIYHLQSGGVYQDADEPPVGTDGYNNQHGLQERIFWSIFKAESDMLPELQLTPTDLQQFDYPSGILSTPESLSLHSQTNDSLPSGSLTRHDEERSWFFYLAELSIRRTINDVLLTFYEKGEWQWIDGIDLVCRHSMNQINKCRFGHLVSPCPYNSTIPNNSPAMNSSTTSKAD
ncbi:hypothetical protein CEP51_016519 [Fusarium floridanum]|uniref:Zn(2)-C6 fungal-type domain-containing protein n=1 Tax=Fusarium floridanum TaxID=1325733 RepID=A0A428NMS3_9HYPO|nr:hypothetical protein CEP51_016519 [Fusarium floridanum]